MKKYINRKTILITSLALLLIVAAGTSLAYIFTNTDPVENKFNPSKVSCAVVENGSAPVAAGTHNTGNEKKDVQIKNTGDTDAYIRAAVVVNWMSADGTKVWAVKPVEGTDYTICYAANTGWVKGSDGYWYYTQPVPPTNGSNLTGILIENAAKQTDGPKGTDGTQYFLSIEIVASAIQAKPASVVTSQWGVTVASDGTISK